MSKTGVDLTPPRRWSEAVLRSALVTGTVLALAGLVVLTVGELDGGQLTATVVLVVLGAIYSFKGASRVTEHVDADEQEGGASLVTRWDPFEDPRGAQDELNQMSLALAHALGLHGLPQGAAAGSTPAWMPALDVSEREDAYLITVELPGVELDDLQITMEGSLLTIQGERHSAHDSAEEQFHRVERRYGAFRRSITLPAHVVMDAVQATVDGGVLQIVAPKAEEAKPQRIQVRPGRADIPSGASSEATSSG